MSTPNTPGAACGDECSTPPSAFYAEYCPPAASQAAPFSTPTAPDDRDTPNYSTPTAFHKRGAFAIEVPYASPATEFYKSPDFSSFAPKPRKDAEATPLEPTIEATADTTPTDDPPLATAPEAADVTKEDINVEKVGSKRKNADPSPAPRKRQKVAKARNSRRESFIPRITDFAEDRRAFLAVPSRERSSRRQSMLPRAPGVQSDGLRRRQSVKPPPTSAKKKVDRRQSMIPSRSTFAVHEDAAPIAAAEETNAKVEAKSKPSQLKPPSRPRRALRPVTNMHMPGSIKPDKLKPTEAQLRAIKRVAVYKKKTATVDSVEVLTMPSR